MLISNEIVLEFLRIFRVLTGDAQTPKFREPINYNGLPMPNGYQIEYAFYQYTIYVISIFLGSVVFTNLLIAIMGQDFDQFMMKWQGIKYQCRAYFIYEILLNLKYFKSID